MMIHCLLLSTIEFGQEYEETKLDSIVQYFSEIKTAIKSGFELWARDLYDNISRLIIMEARFEWDFRAESLLFQTNRIRYNPVSLML